MASHGSPRVKTGTPTESKPREGSGAPPSVHVAPPSAENPYPESPFGTWGAQGAPNGTPQKPWASFHPDTMCSLSGATAIVVSLLPRRPAGAGACRAFTRTLGLTGPESWPCCPEPSPGVGAPRNSSFHVGTVTEPVAAAVCENTGTARSRINTKVATTANRNVVTIPPTMT